MRVFISAALAACSLFASSSFADQMYAPEEFPAVTTAAIAQFKVDMGSMFSMFYGVSLTREIQNGTEMGVYVKVYTQDSTTDSPTVMSKYLCAKGSDGSTTCTGQQ